MRDILQNLTTEVQNHQSQQKQGKPEKLPQIRGN